MKSTAPRAAILGGGLMGRWHAHALAHNGVPVVAVADLDSSVAHRLAARCEGAKVFDDLETLLERARPTALHICTPLPSHFDLAQQALEAGCHLLIEKPLAPTVEETQILLEDAARRDLMLCPVHQFAFQNGVARARRGEVGRIVSLEATFCSAGGDGRAGAELDEIVTHITPHPLSLFQVFLPDALPEHWTISRPAPGELRALANANGVSLALSISLSARPTQSVLTLRGTNGSFVLDLFHGYALRQDGRVSRMRKIAQPFDQSLRHLSAASFNLIGRAVAREAAYPGLRALVGTFYRAIERGEAAPISPRHTLEIARLRQILMEDVRPAP